VALTSNTHFPRTRRGCRALRGHPPTAIISSPVHTISLSSFGTHAGMCCCIVFTWPIVVAQRVIVYSHGFSAVVKCVNFNADYTICQC